MIPVGDRYGGDVGGSLPEVRHRQTARHRLPDVAVIPSRQYNVIDVVIDTAATN